MSKDKRTSHPSTTGKSSTNKTSRLRSLVESARAKTTAPEGESHNRNMMQSARAGRGVGRLMLEGKGKNASRSAPRLVPEPPSATELQARLAKPRALVAAPYVADVSAPEVVGRGGPRVVAPTLSPDSQP